MPTENFKHLANEAKKEIEEIEPEKVKQKLENGEIEIVDVRENDERMQKGAIPGSIHLNRGIVELKIEDEIPDKEQEVVLYCGGGSRSALAARNLQKMGYSNVYSLQGGIRAWKEKGQSVE